MFQASGEGRAVAEAGCFIQLEGPSRVVFVEAGIEYVARTKPLAEGPGGCDLRVDAASLRVAVNCCFEAPVPADETARVMGRLADGLRALGFRPRFQGL
jgi:hypothetical protein